MPGMTITFILIAFPASPCCQLLFSYLTTHMLSLSSVLVHSVTMMSSQTVFLALLVCFSVFSSSLCPHPSSAKKTGCFKVNNCKCIMKDGSGVINLKAMGDADGFLGRLKPVTADNMPVNAEILLSFSPCQAFSQPEDLTGSDCTSVATCLVVRYHRLNRYINHYISFGRHEGNEFHYNDTLKMLSVSYFGPEPESRGAPAHLGGEPLCMSKRLRHGRSGSRYHLPHHPLCQRRCLLHPWLLRAEAFSEQQWIPDLSGAQCVVYDLLPLY